MMIFVLVLVFFSIVGIVVGAYVFANRQRLAAEAALRSRLHGEPVREEAPQIIKDASVSHVQFLDDLLRGKGITETARGRLERAGLTTKPSIFLLSCVVSGAFFLMVGGHWGVFIAIPLGAIGLGLPWMFLSLKTKKRLEKFEAGFPDTLDMMANAMRAGYSFQAAARFVGEEVVAPIGPEFARFYEEQRLGIPVRVALLNMQERIASLNLKMFVTAVLIQRETGGNLTELLGNLATLMRERVALRGHVETLTAEPKMSARFLVALPVLLFFALGAITPEFVKPFNTSTLGHIMLGSAIVSVILGYIFMMKIANIEV